MKVIMKIICKCQVLDSIPKWELIWQRFLFQLIREIHFYVIYTFFPWKIISLGRFKWRSWEKMRIILTLCLDIHLFKKKTFFSRSFVGQWKQSIWMCRKDFFNFHWLFIFAKKHDHFFLGVAQGKKIENKI